MQKYKKLLPLIGLAAAAGLLSGCGQAGAAEPPPTSVTEATPAAADPAPIISAQSASDLELMQALLGDWVHPAHGDIISFTTATGGTDHDSTRNATFGLGHVSLADGSVAEEFSWGVVAGVLTYQIPGFLIQNTHISIELDEGYEVLVMVYGEDNPNAGLQDFWVRPDHPIITLTGIMEVADANNDAESATPAAEAVDPAGVVGTLEFGGFNEFLEFGDYLVRFSEPSIFAPGDNAIRFTGPRLLFELYNLAEVDRLLDGATGFVNIGSALVTDNEPEMRVTLLVPGTLPLQPNSGDLVSTGSDLALSAFGNRSAGGFIWDSPNRDYLVQVYEAMANAVFFVEIGDQSMVIPVNN